MTTPNTLFLAWRSRENRKWYPIGRLTRDNTSFCFEYTNGVLSAKKEGHFEPISSFPNFYAKYKSNSLFPLFANRMLSRSRSDYGEYVQRLNIPYDNDDPLLVLARNEGVRATDAFEVFPLPTCTSDGAYHLHFFAHGLGYFPNNVERVKTLREGEELRLMYDIQNEHDRNAIALRTCESDIKPVGYEIIGWCPRYLLDDQIVKYLVENPTKVVVKVERLNPPPAPTKMRVLCNMTFRCPEHVKFYNADIFQPLSGKENSQAAV